MAKPHIFAGEIPPAAKGPNLRSTPPEKYFTFNFKYWSQIDYFGLGRVQESWFISFLERLKELSKEPVARFFEDREFKNIVRCHQINWDAYNVPITREQLVGLPPEIKNNADEFPIFQIHISKALGRIHGFWDSRLCFNIVLLDPFHNLQPSRDCAYRVTPTVIGQCQYTSLRIAFDNLNDLPCPEPNSDCAQKIRVLGREIEDSHTVIIAALTDDVASEFIRLRQQKGVSVSELLSYGITLFKDQY